MLISWSYTKLAFQCTTLLLMLDVPAKPNQDTLILGHEKIEEVLNFVSLSHPIHAKIKCFGNHIIVAQNGRTAS
jgi:hypothetical protein